MTSAPDSSLSRFVRWRTALLHGVLFFFLAAVLHLLAFLLLSQNSASYAFAANWFDMYLQQNPRTDEVIVVSFAAAAPIAVLLTIISIWAHSAHARRLSIAIAGRLIAKRLLWIALPFVLIPIPLIAAPEGGVVVFATVLMGTVVYGLVALLFSVPLIFAVYADKERAFVLIMVGAIAVIGAAAVAALAMNGYCVNTDHKCRGQNAIRADDISVCTQGVGYTAWCIWDFAVAHKDPTICEQQLDGESRMHCFRKVALATNSIEICKKIPAINQQNMLDYRKGCCAEILKAPRGPYSLTKEQLAACGL